MMPVRVAHLARARKLAAALARLGKHKDAEAIEHLVAVVDDHFEESVRERTTPGALPAMVPTFTVQLVSNYNGNSRLLRWADYGVSHRLIGKPTGNYEGRELHFGTFACFPIHDGGPLIEPEPAAAPEPAPRAPWPFPVSVHKEAA